MKFLWFVIGLLYCFGEGLFCATQSDEFEPEKKKLVVCLPAPQLSLLAQRFTDKKAIFQEEFFINQRHCFIVDRNALLKEYEKRFYFELALALVMYDLNGIENNNLKKLLLNIGGLRDMRDERNCTLLMHAILRGNVGAVCTCISCGMSLVLEEEIKILEAFYTDPSKKIQIFQYITAYFEIVRSLKKK